MQVLGATLLAFASFALSDADSVRVSTIEGTTFEGRFAGVEAGGTFRFEVGDDVRSLQSAELMVIRWLDAARDRPPSDRPFLVCLADGSRIRARLIGGDEQGLTLETDRAGKITVAMRRLAAARFEPYGLPAAIEAFENALRDRDPTQDQLLVVRDEQVRLIRGVTEQLGPQGGTFQWRGREVPIDFENAFGLVFARGVHREPPARMACVLRDETIWGGEITAGDAGQITLRHSDDVTVQLKTSDLAEIRFRSDRVVFLSDLEPARYEFEPFGATPWPYRINRSVSNRPLRIGDRAFTRGIGMHSQATLTYELPEGFTHLAAIIGIDDAARPRGNVVFRVLADGREAFESGPVTGRDDPREILVPLEGAEEIALVVDFGDELDVGDQADWANVRLVKSENPATQASREDP